LPDEFGGPFGLRWVVYVLEPPFGLSLRLHIDEAFYPQTIQFNFALSLFLEASRSFPFFNLLPRASEPSRTLISFPSLAPLFRFNLLQFWLTFLSSQDPPSVSLCQRRYRRQRSLIPGNILRFLPMVKGSTAAPDLTFFFWFLTRAPLPFLDFSP